MLTDALVVAEPGAAFKLQPIEVNENIRDNEVLIKIRATGVCHTDLNFSKETGIPGLFPAVFGHEGNPNTLHTFASSSSSSSSSSLVPLMILFIM